MKTSCSILFMLSFICIHAQVMLSGKVVDEKGNPLQGASVYINSTTIGTSSDADGYFKLSVEHGHYILSASYVGFETTGYNVNTLDLPDEIVFILFENDNRLDEIVITSNRKWASRRPLFMEQFIKHFLGESYLGERAYIKNKHVLEFQYDENTNLLEAFAPEPLIIENKGLGYKIIYDLVHFELRDFGVSYVGFVRYENLEGSERKKRKWAKERELAYYGSLRHFLTTTIKGESKSGFVVDKVKLVLNPNLPSEEEVKSARELVKRYIGFQLNPRSSFDMQMQQRLESANYALRKSKGNRFIEIPVQNGLSRDDYFVEDEDGLFLFLDSDENMALRVTYLDAYQEGNYRKLSGDSSGTKGQVSRMTLYDERILINPKGLFHNPMDVFLEGYWGFKKVPDQLPLDYKPMKNANK